MLRKAGLPVLRVQGSESRRTAQDFTSTIAGGGYGGERALGTEFGGVCRQLLRTAYLGTLLAAASLRRDRVVLTLIGGGVFGNPVSLILEAIAWAAEEVERLLAKDLCGGERLQFRGHHRSAQCRPSARIDTRWRHCSVRPRRRHGGTALTRRADHMDNGLPFERSWRIEVGKVIGGRFPGTPNLDGFSGESFLVFNR